MIISKLLDIWHAESAIRDRKPLQGQLLDLPHVKAYAGIEPGTNRRFLVFRLDKEQQRSIKDRRLRSTKGIKTTDVGHDGVVVMTEQPGIPSSVFPAVISDVLAVAATAEPTTAVKRAFDRFNSWQAALERRAGPMTAREVRGAIGELILLRDILTPALGIQKSLERWTALGSDPLHDFGGEGWILEAKACLSTEKRIHLSLGQLDAAGSVVFLGVVELESLSVGSSIGISLADLISEMEASIGDEAVRTALQNALVLRGLRAPDIESEARARYSHRGTLCFRVDHDFPVLRRASIPSAVLAARYEVDVFECMRCTVTSQQIVDAVTYCEGEL